MKKYELCNIKQNIPDNIGTFICCASFEDRSCSIAKNLDVSKIAKAVIFYNEKFVSVSQKNIDKLKHTFDDKSVVKELKTDDSIYSTDVILGALSDISKDDDAKIVIDITCFTHESLLILFRILVELQLLDSSTFIYCSTDDYSCNKKDVAQKWLSKGIIDVRSVIGYPGNILPSKKCHLIVLTGFEHERAYSLIENIQPNSLALAYGKASNETTSKNKDASRLFTELLERKYRLYPKEVLESFEIYCDNLKETIMVLSENIEKHSDENIILAPMNNKITTLGCALVALKYTNVQICYTEPFQYNVEHYSQPGSSCYIFNLKNYLQEGPLY